MAKNLQIKLTGQSENPPLSKEQKRFNRLVGKIQVLRKNMQRNHELELELRQIGNARVAPAEKAVFAALRELVLALDAHHYVEALTKTQFEKFSRILFEQVESLLDTIFYEDDMVLKDLYQKYNPIATQSWDDQQAEEAEHQKKMAADYYNERFGLDLTAQDLEDPAKLQEKIAEKQAELEAAAQADAADKEQKKTPKQLRKEEKMKAAGAVIAKTAKQIYLDLVRHFHPDRELDEQKRVEKTEIMKQITAAYAADDHIQLLELQMTLLVDRQNLFTGMDDLQLKYFNEILQSQVSQLEFEDTFFSPADHGNIYASLFVKSRPWMLQRIETYIKDRKEGLISIQNILRETRKPTGLTAFIKDYQLRENDFRLYT